MRITQLNDTISEFQEGSWRGWRSKRPGATGLSLTLTATGKVMVTTHAPQSPHFLPAGNAPLEVSLPVEVTTSNGAPSFHWEPATFRFVFGDRSAPVPDDVKEAAYDIIEQFCADVAATDRFQMSRAAVVGQIVSKRRVASAKQLRKTAEQVAAYAHQIDSGIAPSAAAAASLARELERAVELITA